MDRKEYLKWCRERALAELEASVPVQSLASIISDLNNWEGNQDDEPIYSDTQMDALQAMGVVAAMSGASGMRHFIEGLN